jgi:hypothetical protein
VTAPADQPIDPGALIRSRGYLGVLTLAAIVGIVVSIAGWGFLELTVRMQHWVYVDLPTGIGFSATPWWWPLPILGIAGVPIAYAIVRMPGHGGHRPPPGCRPDHRRCPRCCPASCSRRSPASGSA